ncbi:MAG: poly(ethylene terephthalate) hydrolase family protein [Sporichthyaceae bacterium]
MSVGLALVASLALSVPAAAPSQARTTMVDTLVGVELGTPVDARFSAPGPWQVAVSEIKVPGSALTFRVVHPRDLGGRGVSHPILAWGNGTNATTLNYPGVIEQLASWGFVVIGSDDPQQASGVTILDAVREMIAAAADPASAFYDVLDTRRIGALGHSQGAGGAINAAIRAGGLIDTVVPINLPDVHFVADSARFDAPQFTTPTFLVGGEADYLFASPAGLRSYYEQMPRAALGVLRGADHLTIQRSGGGYLGYLTAWMRWQLMSDRYAGRAFTGVEPELARNPHWQGELAKGVL